MFTPMLLPIPRQPRLKSLCGSVEVRGTRSILYSRIIPISITTKKSSTPALRPKTRTAGSGVSFALERSSLDIQSLRGFTRWKWDLRHAVENPSSYSRNLLLTLGMLVRPRSIIINTTTPTHALIPMPLCSRTRSATRTTMVLVILNVEGLLSPFVLHVRTKCTFWMFPLTCGLQKLNMMIPLLLDTLKDMETKTPLPTVDPQHQCPSRYNVTG